MMIWNKVLQNIKQLGILRRIDQRSLYILQNIVIIKVYIFLEDILEIETIMFYFFWGLITIIQL